MNSAVRAVVRTALYNKVKAVGVFKGYQGLIKGDFKNLDRRSVSGIINLGGTILKTARSKDFLLKKNREKAYLNLINYGIDGLVVIGGDGSFRGAYKFGKEFNFPIIGIPGTIDNDIVGTDFTLGADTAVNVALDAVDKIRDTVDSMERIFVIEVMGRNCGYIALETGLAGGCEEAVIPENKYNINKICGRIVRGHKQGKVSWIIIVAEGAVSGYDIASEIREKTSLEVRVTVLGHIQRGGRPTARDRILGSKFGSFAVELLLKGVKGKTVGVKADKLTAIDFKNAVDNKKWLNSGSYLKLIRVLT